MNHPAAHGRQLISRGFPLETKDDLETIDRACFVYDALYASIAERQNQVVPGLTEKGCRR